MAAGSEKAAAHRLGLSHSTVKHHLANARSKVGAATTAQLVWILAPRGITLVSDGDNIDPGGTQTRTVDLTQPGSYLFVCNIPGHFKAGMFSAVTVTP